MAIRNRLQCEFYANLLSAKNDVSRGGSAGSTARPYLSSYSSIRTRVPGTAVLKPTKFSTAALNLVVNAYMYCSTNRTRRTGYYSCSTYMVLNLVYACHTGCTSVIQRIDSDGLCACARASWRAWRRRTCILSHPWLKHRDMGQNFQKSQKRQSWS